MATFTPTNDGNIAGDGSVAMFTWPTMANGDDGSAVELIPWADRCVQVTGTFGAGVVTWNANSDDDAAAPTGTAVTEVNMLIGGSANANGRALTTATVPTPTPIRPFASLGAPLATTALGPWVIKDRVDGAIVVKPGCSISLHATAAAGTSPLVVFGVTWQEVAE